MYQVFTLKAGLDKTCFAKVLNDTNARALELSNFDY